MEENNDLKDPLIYIPKYLKVLSKADDYGLSNLVPMELKPIQKYYIENRTHRDLILKGRQMGSSTGVMAANAHKCFTEKFMKMSIVTHKEDVSQFLFQTVVRFLRNLPKDNSPSNKSSRRHILLDKLDGFIHIDTAESEAIGFGETLNIAHLSEMSRWPQNKARDLFNGMSQTVPPGGFITIESTPRGRGGLFYELYKAAKEGVSGYKLFFFPWWWEPGYTMEPDPKNADLEMAAVRLGIPLGELEKEEKILKEKFHLTDGQIAFRREKQRELAREFYQEYPENDEDCWLTSDINVFDGLVLKQYLMECEDGVQDGDITTWKGPIGGENYVIGVDVAAGLAKGDYSVASVLNVKRNEYVCRLRGRIPPDLFAQRLMEIGHKYNSAMIGVEKTNHGHSVLRVLLENNYPEIYHREEYDQVQKEYKMHEPGWYTTVKTKPLMVNTLAASFRARDIRTWSENFCAEAMSYVSEGEAKYRPSSRSEHDDELDAVMIALQLRETAPIAEPARYRPSYYATIV